MISPSLVIGTDMVGGSHTYDELGPIVGDIPYGDKLKVVFCKFVVVPSKWITKRSLLRRRYVGLGGATMKLLMAYTFPTNSLPAKQCLMFARATQWITSP